MLERIKKWFVGETVGEQSAATQMPPVDVPKTKAGQRGRPDYLTSANPRRDEPLRLNDRRLATVDLSRTPTRSDTTRNLVRLLGHASPDLSAAVFAYIRTSITRTYKAVARNMDGTVNVDGTQLVQQLLTRFDLLPGYAQGFGGLGSMRSNSESFAKELIFYGGCAAELVLDKTRLPLRIQPLTTTNIQFFPDKEGLNPKQVLGSDEIDLDFPTFFYTALDMELMEAYPSSPLESALQPTLFSEQFLADVRRVVRRSVHPRIKVEIDEESFRKYLPAAAASNDEKFAEYYNQMTAAIEEKINSLEPEEALIHSSTLKIALENNGNISLSSEYQTLENMSNAKMATGAKVMPSILGHNTGSSNIASTETLIFMKQAEGAVQMKLNEMYSRILTLAVRLFGLDVYVEFAYDPINLRPETELETFRAMHQSRTLELLSVGLIDDVTAAIELTGHLPPEGYVPKAGTMFRSQKVEYQDGYDGASNAGSTLNQNLGKGANDGAKGQNRKRNSLKE